MKKTRILTILVLALGPAIETANADFVFGTPTPLGPPVNSPYGEAVSSLSSDGLTLYFSSSRPGVQGLAEATREHISDPWGEPVSLGPVVNGPGLHNGPSISVDGLSLYFHSTRPGGYGEADLYVTTRKTTEHEWGVPVNLGPSVNSSAYESKPSISADGLRLFFASGRPGGYGDFDLWVTTRVSKDDDWGTPVNLGPTVNTSQKEAAPCVSADDLVLFFLSNQPNGGGFEQFDLWMTRRPTATDPWDPPVKLGPTVNSSTMDGGPNISADGRTLFFFSTRPGGPGDWDLWQVPIDPVVDFNGNYRVDIEDLRTLIEHWGQNEPAFDMAPMPWGDGVIDAVDLEVLMSYWGQELDPNLLACWKLDKAGGNFAHDSAAENHATVMGDAIWWPDGGQAGGALQFDGVDDYLTAPFILDPARQPFSVFAWIRGGQPGQTVISQQGAFGAWLFVDSAGALATGLTFPMPAVVSNIVVTDDRWRHIGLVSDAAGMSLYVDDMEVARTDTSPVLPATGDLHIGAGSNLEPGTFWSGLIDDVRIYDRVVIP